MGTMFVSGQWGTGIQSLTIQIPAMISENDKRLIGSQYLDEVKAEVEGQETLLQVFEAAKEPHSIKKMRPVLVYRE